MIVLRWQKRLLWHYSVVRISVLQTLPTEFCFSVMHCGTEQWRRYCHQSWGSRPEATSLSLLQSSFLPFPLVDSPGCQGRARSPAAKHFGTVYTVKQPYKIHV